MQQIINDALKLISQSITTLKDIHNMDGDKYTYAVKLLEQAVDILAS